jgi:hypothetical protein
VNRDTLCFSFNEPSGLIEYKLPFHDATKIIPSALTVADEDIVSPVLKVHFNVPSGLIAYKLPFFAPT